MLISNPLKSTKWPQFVFTVAVSICSVSLGMHFGWTSPSIPIILEGNSSVSMTKEETSYLGVLAPVGDLIGVPFAALIIDKLGRKITLLCVAGPHLISWLLTAVAEAPGVLYAARVFAGIAEGMVLTVLPIYVSEVAEPSIRGVLGCGLPVTTLLGVAIINSLGPFLSIPAAAYVSAAVTVGFFVLCLPMPDSPYYLLMKGKGAEAERALRHFRNGTNVDAELKAITADVARQLSERGTYKDLFLVGSNRKALVITLGLRAMQQFSGVAAFTIYMQTIFEESDSGLSPATSAMIYTWLQVATATACSVLADRFGRLPPLIVSTIGCGACLLLEAGFFFLSEQTDVDVSAFNWVPIFGMLAFVVAFSIGLGNIPNVVLGELFSSSVKAKAVLINNLFFAACIAAFSKFFQAMGDAFGMYVPFLVFSVCCFLSLIFAFTYVPETNGKTLEEIQQHLKGSTKANGAV